MERHRPELEGVLRETFPKVQAVHDRIDAELRAILNDAQRVKFDAWKAQRPARPHGGRPGFGPPGFARPFPGGGPEGPER
jgi:hypothetical protein